MSSGIEFQSFSAEDEKVRSQFQSIGAEDEKVRSPYVTDLTVGRVRIERLEDRNVRGGEYSSISVIK